MTNEQGVTECPSAADLLGAVEDAYPEGEAIRLHTRRCPSCSRQLATMLNLLEALNRAHTQDTAAGAAERERRLLRRLESRTRRRWPATCPAWRLAAAGVVAALGLALAHQQPGAVDELLSRAAAREEASAGDMPARMSLRVMPGSAGREAAAGACASWVGILASGREAARHVPVTAARRLMESFAHPLSASTYRTWRRREAWPRDFITAQEDGLLILRTVTVAGPVRMAELVLRQDTYRVVGLRIVGDACRVHIEAVETAPGI